MAGIQRGAASGGRLWGYLGAAAALVFAICFALCMPAVLAGETLRAGWSWAPSLGVSLAFMLDGLSLIFALLISGIGALILLYATGYMGDHPQFGRFVLYLFSFMLSMLGLVLASDLITLFVFWELTSVTSYLLIGFNHEDSVARRNALQAMLVTGAGGLALLAGFILIGMASGSYDIGALLAGEGLQSHPLYTPILILVLLGAFTKSAQFPFHFWLPNAMAAPTPVSAYLHSATMVKAGIYLLARLHPALGGTTAWVATLTTAGLVTAVMASLLALRQTDLKQALAYTTLMALGTITVLLAGGSPYALTAAVTFLVVHSLYKAALFMVVGAIDHGTGTREAGRLGGLARVMPMTAAAAALAAASMAGFPPLLGWIGKELIYAGTPSIAPWGLAVAGALVANALMVAVAGVVALRPFWGAPGDPPHTPHEAGWQMLIGPLLLGCLGLVLGLGAGLLQPLIDRAVEGSLQLPRTAELHLWAGVNLPFLLSLATFALGFLLYAGRERYRTAFAALLARLPVFDRGWDAFLDGFRAFAAWQTRVIQPGRLSGYLSATFAVAVLALGGTLILKGPVIAPDLSAPLLLWLIAGIVVAGAALASVAMSRITAISAVGTVGIGVALIFISFGAPDVATTQLMVETLSAVLFGIAMLRLPGMVERRPRARKVVHGVIAGAAGLTVTLIILAVTSHPLDRRITSYFEASSYALAHGLNIVNVILVDFRAFDTFGELTVILLASIGAYALLKRRMSK
ncbi:oxidoreductase [Haematobacter missouriensis]|uniref:Na(+)/H(+) antiporter subunit A n=1 Tax=Haematobacter missouriensis TaxID=366616 RepID=A0A212ASC5_9RHOB|nr:hydrogen gas-evolving membrane-bound hydrogenase subunit E [Haematobacter missouriensis]KFI29829.1 oxidoreductase [Haematobacter missouriensis]OWJ75958.1 Na(+)/H(+) antiporter subunit A [Haematobacter missouriensis]OWJ84401.1 Na(+)/H(+) antiporter subunit A [Haematobacter missouriensis]